MSQTELNRRYLCHHAADHFTKVSPDRRIVTTGFGMSGSPHMATVSHVMKMIEFQRQGEQCQIVLGDLDAYNGRARPYTYTRELADKFVAFVQRLGFNSQIGILRDQASAENVLATMYLTGRYTEDDDFEQAEEDGHAYYAARGLVDATMTFRRRLSLTLMAADFIQLGQDHDAVLVMLGIDEHKYVRFTQDVVARFDEHIPLRGDFVVAGLYTRLNVGFNGHPKFSKSIPGSAITVDTPADEIRRLVRSDTGGDPASSPVFQLMCQMPASNDPALDELHAICTLGGRDWQVRRDTFADRLIHIGELWSR